MLAPVVRGGAAGVRALLKRAHGHRMRGSLTKAAERFLRRQVDLEESSPFDHTPTARAEHAARMSEAQAALMEGRPARMAVAPQAAVREDVAIPPHVGVTGDDELSRQASTLAAEARGRPQTPEVTVSQASDSAPPPQPSRPPLAKRTLAEEAPEVDSPAARAEDDALESRVRAFAEAEPNARVTIEDSDTVRSLTARELVDELDNDRSFVEQVTACLGGAL